MSALFEARQATPVPGRDRLRITPKAQLGAVCGSVGLAVGPALLGSLLGRVGEVVPGQAGLDLCQVGVPAANDNAADQTAIAITFVPVDGDLLAMHELAQVAPGDLAEGLATLGGVNATQTHDVLYVISVQNGDSVAVSDMHDTPRQLCPADMRGKEQQDGGDCSHIGHASCAAALSPPSRGNASTQSQVRRPAGARRSWNQGDGRAEGLFRLRKCAL
jgi:hypothetical protein